MSKRGKKKKERHLYYVQDLPFLQLVGGEKKGKARRVLSRKKGGKKETQDTLARAPE